MENDHPSNWSFQKLSDFISSIEFSDLAKYTLKRFRQDPVNSRSIERLVDEGWKLHFSDNPEEYLIDVCIPKPFKKIIIFREHLPYKRDNIICHEIIHAIYEGIVSDGPFNSSGEVKNINNAIVEYYARKMRANPKILATIWENFRIPPSIYDLPSLLATQELIRPQLLFPSFKEDYNFTLMD